MMTQKEPSLSVSTFLVLALTAVVPLVVATGFSNFERPRQVALAVLGALALISWSIGAIRRGGPKVASPGTLALGAAFVSTAGASLLWSELPLFGAISVVTWVGLGAVFLVLCAPVGRRPDFLEWTTAVAAGALGAAGLGLYDFFGGTALAPVWDPAGATGGFDAMAFATAYYAIAIPLLMGAVLVSKGLRRWFMATALVLASLHLALVVDLVAAAILLGAMVVMSAVIRLMSASGGPGLSAKSLAAVGLSLALVAGGLLFMDRPDKENLAVDLPRVSSSGAFDTEMASQAQMTWWYFAADRMESPVDQRFRSYLNSVARGMWEQEPIIGHGAGGWWLMQTDVMDDSDPVVRRLFEHYPAFKSPHSDYARVLVEQGALGLLLLLLWMTGVATAIAAGMRGPMLENRDDKVVMWALCTALLVGAALMFFVPVLELISSAVIWVGAAAIAVGQASRGSEKGDWNGTYDAGTGASALRYGAVLLSCLVAVSMAHVGVTNGKASLERGHADHLMYRMMFSDSIGPYLAAHETYPAHPEVLYNVALAHKLVGDTKKGLDAIEEAAEMRPHDARIRAHAGEVSVLDGRMVTGWEHGREAVRTGPNYLRGYEVFATAMQRRGAYDDSATLFKALIDREPPAEDLVVARIRYANLLYNQLDEPEEALKQFEIALETTPVGHERSLLLDRVNELENRLKREELLEAGEPLPPELNPAIQENLGHDHDHGPFDLHDH